MKQNRLLKTSVLVLIDVFTVVLSYYVTQLLLPDSAVKEIWSIPIFCLVDIIALVGFFFLFRVYSSILRYAGANELIKIAFIAFIIGLLNFVISFIPAIGIKTRFVLVYSLILFCALIVIRFSYRFYSQYILKAPRVKQEYKRCMVIGAGDAGCMFIKELKESNKLNKEPVCIIDSDPLKLHQTVYNVPVVGTDKDIIKYAALYNIDEIIIAIPSSKREEKNKIINVCKETGCKTSILPSLYDLTNGLVSASQIRDVEIQDLLGRGEIKINIDEVASYIKDKVVLVTGGGGSIGSELCRQIAKHSPKQLIILDIYENNAYDIEQELKRKYQASLNLLTLIGSIRDKGKIDDIFKKYNIDIVFNAAAHKHVPLMETSPNEAIKNNVFGTLNLARVADKYKVKRFVQISTDKAVNPTNVMGASKRLCEMIIQAMAKVSKNTEYVAVRFGNVLGSNGSVIPLFKKQMAEGGPVTVTDKNIIRYFMTIPEAVSLVLQAGAYAKGGEIYVLDMGEPCRIYDLAVNLIKLSGYKPGIDMKIEITGLRPGEKLYEERLMSEEGLKSTANGLISVAKPIEFNEETFFDSLDELYTEAYKETERMKELVSSLVPTYKIDKR